MDALIVQFNALVNIAMSLAIIGAVLSNRVKDGVIIKGGLILMAIGFGSKIVTLYDGLSCEDMVGLSRSNLLVHIGVAIVVLGYVRRIASHRKRRRTTDWVDLDTRPQESAR